MPYGWTIAQSQQSMTDAIRRDSGRGQAAEDSYYGRALAFDPMRSVERYARGAGDIARTGFREELRDLRGDAVGRGRLDTGFFDEDVGDLWKDTQRDLNSRIAMQATEAAGLELRNNEGIGQYGANVQDRYRDMLAVIRARQTAENNVRRSRRPLAWLGRNLGAGIKLAAEVAASRSGGGR